MREFRHAFGALINSPGYSLVAVATVALGIGVNVAMFSVVDAVLFRPLPFSDPHMLVAFTASDTKTGAQYDIFGLPDIEDLRAETDLFERVAIYQGTTAVLKREETIERVNARQVSGEFFQTFAVPPHAGRWIATDDSPATVVLAHDFWRQRFGSDVHAVGRNIELSGVSHEVVGVMPAGFDVPGNADMWVPIQVRPMLLQRGARGLLALGRLRRGVSVADARVRVAALSARISADFPRSHASIQTDVVPFRDSLLGRSRLALTVLFGAVAAILLIAIANLATLASVRSAQRRAELAVRGSLGASRAHIFRLIMAESALVAAAGGAGGFVLAHVTLGSVVPLIPEGLPGTGAIALDARVIAFGLAIAAFTGLASGLGPAYQASGGDPFRAIKEEGGGGVGPAGHRTLSLLVTSQVALTLVLVAISALLINSFVRLAATDPGITTHNVVTFALQGTGASGWGVPAAEYARVSDEIFSRLEHHPDVAAAARSGVAPLRGLSITGGFRLEGASSSVSNRAEDDANLNIVSDDYFQVFRIGLVAGRLFGAADRAGSPDVVVINETLARRFFDGNGIGRRISIPGRGNRHAEIVGIVRDVRQHSPGLPARPEVYWSLSQSNERPWHFSVRTSGDPARVAADIPGLVRSISDRFFADRLATADQILWASIAEERFRTALTAAYSGLAILLAMVGVYGVIAFVVTRRQREIGVRMALGAGRGEVFRMIIGQGFAPCLAGIAIGAVLSLAAVHSVEGLLFEVSPGDPWTFAVAVTLVGTAGLCACLIPARRATRVDPLVALRYE